MGYIDTSVLAAYYCPEPLSSVAEAEIRALGSPTLSRLAEVELNSAVAIKVRTGSLAVDSAVQIMSKFQFHLAAGCYRVVSLSDIEFALARDWVGRFTAPLRTLDALHLACSYTNGLTILTADVGLARSAAILGVPHRLLA